MLCQNSLHYLLAASGLCESEVPEIKVGGKQKTQGWILGPLKHQMNE